MNNEFWAGSEGNCIHRPTNNDSNQATLTLQVETESYEGYSVDDDDRNGEVAGLPRGEKVQKMDETLEATILYAFGRKSDRESHSHSAHGICTIYTSSSRHSYEKGRWCFLRRRVIPTIAGARSEDEAHLEPLKLLRAIRFHHARPSHHLDLPSGLCWYSTVTCLRWGYVGCRHNYRYWSLCHSWWGHRL